MEVNDLSIFLFRPFVIFNVRIEMIVPSLSTLLSNSPWQVGRNMAPVLGPMLKHKPDYYLILLLSPRPLRQRRIKHLLPSVQALDVSSAFQFSSNLFPPLSPVFLNQSPQILILKVITPYLFLSPVLLQLLL